jgi:hypothetical protein
MLGIGRLSPGGMETLMVLLLEIADQGSDRSENRVQKTKRLSGVKESMGWFLPVVGSGRRKDGADVTP